MGSFFNGHYDEEPARHIVMPQGFWMGQYEVTQAEWNAVVGHNPSMVRGDDLPVDNVKWDEAVAFCEQLSGRLGRVVRLPTEAEWEYACRAGKQTQFYFGSDASKLAEFANFCEGSNASGFHWQDLTQNDGFDKIAPAGSFEANPWGLHDILGNVSEWCSDYYAPYEATGVLEQPTGPEKGETRVLTWWVVGKCGQLLPLGSPLRFPSSNTAGGQLRITRRNRTGITNPGQ